MIFLDDLAPGGLLGAMLDGFERSQRGMGPRSGGESGPIEAVPNPIGMFAPSVPYDESGDGLRQYFARHMELALAFYVDPRMTALVTAAAESLPEDTVLRPRGPARHPRLPAAARRARRDRPARPADGAQRRRLVPARRRRRPVVPEQQVRRAGHGQPRLAARRSATTTPGCRRSLARGLQPRSSSVRACPLSIGATKVLPPEITEQLRGHPGPGDRAGTPAIWGEGYDLNEWLGDAMELRPNAAVAWIFAMWRLMQQTLTDVRTEEVDRALRKAVPGRRKMKRDDRHRDHAAQAQADRGRPRVRDRVVPPVTSAAGTGGRPGSGPATADSATSATRRRSGSTRCWCSPTARTCRSWSATTCTRSKDEPERLGLAKLESGRVRTQGR